MRYTHAFFDLDGTVTDSAPGITRSVQYALRKFGITPPTEKELTVFVGPPLTWSFSHFFGMNADESRQAVAFYREYYSQKGILECKVYGGIPALLETLNRAGIVCVLATCKPHFYANTILQRFRLDRYFTFVSGPELDGTRGEKHEVIACAMDKLRLSDPSSILMIGDRDNDVLGAKRHGIDCAGALWGFGSEDELTNAGAKYLCPSPADVQKLLIPSATFFNWE